MLDCKFQQSIQIERGTKSCGEGLHNFQRNRSNSAKMQRWWRPYATNPKACFFFWEFTFSSDQLYGVERYVPKENDLAKRKLWAHIRLELSTSAYGTFLECPILGIILEIQKRLNIGAPVESVEREVSKWLEMRACAEVHSGHHCSHIRRS